MPRMNTLHNCHAALLMVSHAAAFAIDLQEPATTVDGLGLWSAILALVNLRPYTEGSVSVANNTAAASMYALGQGVTRDWAEAGRCYRKTAEQGLADAQPKLFLPVFAGILRL